MKWFRFYHDAIDHPKVQRLPGNLFKFWVNMLCLASRSDDRGLVKLDIEAIAFATRTTDEEAAAMIADLTRRNLLEECTEGLAVHNWNDRQFKSDSSAERVAKHRSNADPDDGNGGRNVTDDVTETPKPSVIQITDTDTELTPLTPQGGDEPEEPADPPKQAEKPKRSRRGASSAIPDDFTPTPKRIEFAVAEGLTDVEARHEFRKFQSHAVATDRRMVDWEATWRTWVLKAVEDRQKRTGSMTVLNGGNPRPSPGKRGFTGDELLAMSRANPDDEERSIFGDVIETKGRIAR